MSLVSVRVREGRLGVITVVTLIGRFTALAGFGRSLWTVMVAVVVVVAGCSSGASVEEPSAASLDAAMGSTATSFERRVLHGRSRSSSE